MTTCTRESLYRYGKQSTNYKKVSNLYRGAYKICLEVAVPDVMIEGDLNGFVGMRVKHSTSRRTCDNKFISFGFFCSKNRLKYQKPAVLDLLSKKKNIPVQTRMEIFFFRKNRSSEFLTNTLRKQSERVLNTAITTLNFSFS